MIIADDSHLLLQLLNNAQNYTMNHFLVCRWTHVPTALSLLVG